MLKIILLLVIILLLLKYKEGNQSRDNILIAFFDKKDNDESKKIKFQMQNINNGRLIPII